MANSNLTSAKKAKNDEFYTQYPDIQKEIGAYLMFNPDTFKGKVVYCNCDDPFESNFFRYFTINFKRLGLKRLITTSYKPSPIDETQLVLTGIIEQGEAPVKGRKKPQAKRFIINDVGDLNGDGAFNNSDIAQQLQANKHNEWEVLKGDKDYPAGDFRSTECVELLKQSDIVVTNPPFSLYREYMAQLVEYNKKFVIIGNKTTITHKEIFPLIKENELWVGTSSFSKDILFIAPKGADLSDKPKTAVRIVNGETLLRSPSVWFTNIDHGRRHQPLSLMTMADNCKHNKKVVKSDTAYKQYDNYDAIEVPFTDAIPSDYDGVMGVPISFLDKYSPEQFEIIGMAKRGAGDPSLKTKVYTKNDYNNYSDLNATPVIITSDGPKNTFPRILIKHRKAAA